MPEKTKLAALAEFAAKTAREFYEFNRACEKKQIRDDRIDIDIVMTDSYERKKRWPVQPMKFILSVPGGRDTLLYDIAEYEINKAHTMAITYDIPMKQDIARSGEIEFMPCPLPENVSKKHKGMISAGILIWSRGLENILMFTPRLGEFPMALVVYYLFKDSVDLSGRNAQFRAYGGQ